jgi:hypothetical protein
MRGSDYTFFIGLGLIALSILGTFLIGFGKFCDRMFYELGPFGILPIMAFVGLLAFVLSIVWMEIQPKQPVTKPETQTKN